jgi:anti-sigma factor RsiW
MDIARNNPEKRQPVTCREFADFMADYLSGELRPETTAQFEHHLSICPNCVAYLSNYRDTVALGRQAFDDPDAAVPEAVPEGLVNAILRSRKG